MAKQAKAKPEVRFIRQKDAAHILGIPLEILPGLIAKLGLKTLRNEWDELGISADDVSGLHENSLVISCADTAFRNEAERRIQDAVSGKNKYFEQDIRIKLGEFRNHIALLERTHAKYLTRVRPVHNQTPLMAAYLLYARVINLLNLGCACIEAGYWTAGIVLRQIDESIQVAEYFSSSDPTPKLRRDVVRWFRENRTPQPADLRKALSSRLALNLGDKEAERHLYEMGDIYERQSKWVHPAFSPIRETLRTYPLEKSAAITGFDYGPSSYPRKMHELTLFYRSSVWTAVQGFVVCFYEQIPLDPDDAEPLLELNKRFSSERDGM